MRHPLHVFSPVVKAAAGAVLFLAALSAGCSPKPPAAAPAPDPAGTWVLESVNGSKVPCTVQHGGASISVKSGLFVIRADGTCTSRVVFSPPSGGEVAREVRATYVRHGDTLEMAWEGAGTNTGTVDGKTFTMNNEGMLFTYRR